MNGTIMETGKLQLVSEFPNSNNCIIKELYMELKEQIINAVLLELGCGNLKFTMDDIAKRLSVSKKTIYAIFPSKEELLISTMDFFFERIKEKQNQILLEDTTDSVQKLKNILIAMPDNTSDIDFRDISIIKDKYPKVYKKLKKHLSDEWEPTFKLYRQCVSEGKLIQIPELILKLTIEGAFQEFLGSKDLKKSTISYREAQQELINIVFSGLEVR